MSYHEPQGWPAPVRQASWEQPPPPSRSGASSTSQREDIAAFAQQFEEIDRAVDNLIKSGKFYPAGPRGPMPVMMGAGRRSGEYSSRHSGRHSHGSEFDPARSHSASNLQNFYANQRYGRPSDAEQMAQAKRKVAAQRERELRNYHQEQQYNRSVMADVSSTKSDRSMSPSTLSEESRRELIARQHRALYGNESSSYLSQGMYGEGNESRDSGGNPSNSTTSGGRGNSPRGVDPFGMGPSAQGEGNTQGSSMQDTNRPDKSSSPGNGAAHPSFGAFDNNQTSGKVSTSPHGEEGHQRSMSKSTTAPVGGNMGPIGSRPSVQQAPNQGLNKRTTSPLPSGLSYGSMHNNEQNNERAPSSNSNANNQAQNSNSSMGAWGGGGGGVWGNNKIGTTSVWG